VDLRCAKNEILLLLALQVIIFFCPALGETAGWSPTGSLTDARGEHTATLLPNGKVPRDYH